MLILPSSQPAGQLIHARSRVERSFRYMQFSFLNTKRLIIRRLRLEDASAIAEYRSYPDVAKFQSWSEYTFQQAIQLINEMDTSDPTIRDRWFQFGITLKETDHLIGDIGFLNTDKEGKSWIGFTLNSKFWNRGYAYESVCAVLTYYKDIGVSKVWASVDPQNNLSSKLLEKLGFSLLEREAGAFIYFKNNS